MSALAIGDNPQIQALQMFWRRTVDVRPVLLSVSEQGLICCWSDKQQWLQRSGSWPAGSCRDGVPLQRELMAELLADLLLDSDVVGAQIVLCLPLAAANWRVLEGRSLQELQALEDPRSLLSGVDWPDDLQASYLAFDACAEAVIATSVQRSLLQAWVDVVEQADLPLHRVDWCLTAAHRSIQRFTSSCTAPLAWLIVEASVARLVLIRDSVPELDLQVVVSDPAAVIPALRQRVEAWFSATPDQQVLAWWLTVPDSEHAQWSALVDTTSGERLLNEALPWSPVVWDQTVENLVLTPLHQLAFTALQQEL